MTALEDIFTEVKQSVIKSLPDWRDGSQYPSQSSKSSDVWAWQFLRRNEEYWKSWVEYREATRYRILKNNMDGMMLKMLGIKWGLRQGIKAPYSIDWDSPTRFLVSPDIRLASIWDPVTKKRVNRDLDSLFATEICMIFNTALPIDSQIKSAKSVLKRFQSEVPEFEEGARAQSRAPYNDYSLLLRVLDSKLCGARPTVAAQKILPKPDSIEGSGNPELYKKYKKLVDTAVEISNDRYLNIAMRS